MLEMTFWPVWFISHSVYYYYYIVRLLCSPNSGFEIGTLQVMLRLLAFHSQQLNSHISSHLLSFPCSSFSVIPRGFDSDPPLLLLPDEGIKRFVSNLPPLLYPLL